MIVYVVPVIFLVSIFACHAIARSRGAKPVFWGVMGALFGPLAIPFVYLAKPADLTNGME